MTRFVPIEKLLWELYESSYAFLENRLSKERIPALCLMSRKYKVSIGLAINGII